MGPFPRWLIGLAAVVLGACGPGQESSPVDASPVTPPASAVGEPIGLAPDGAEPSAAVRALVDAFGSDLGPELVTPVIASGDPGVAWVLADLLRFYRRGSPSADALIEGLEHLGVPIDPVRPWVSAIDYLIASDVPAPHGYRAVKVAILGAVDQRWASLFEDPVLADLRLVGWGGVFMDDRPLGDRGACRDRGCIPALDVPAVTEVVEGAWYGAERLVLGVVVEGQARAYPLHQMEVHEMVNDVLGGRRIAVPYCTLCGSGQAYYTDRVLVGDGEVDLEDPLVLRTSGLLSRSNKVMYDLGSGSIIDTFTGEAVTGTLAADGVELIPISVRVTTWGQWREVHPSTTIVAADGGVGRIYPDDPLAGRDDDGPIFPIGDVDPRLGVHDVVLGAMTRSGTPVAFPVVALSALAEGEVAEHAGLTAVSDGAGWVVSDEQGELPSHQSFWFAWSQFRPTTQVWPG